MRGGDAVIPSVGCRRAFWLGFRPVFGVLIGIGADDCIHGILQKRHTNSSLRIMKSARLSRTPHNNEKPICKCAVGIYSSDDSCASIIAHMIIFVNVLGFYFAIR